MKRSYHIYECEDCCVTFAVEQAYEDQSAVCCPVCLDDDYLATVGHGEMEEIPESEVAAE
ncbi:hypothetical protein [Effusibacillus consociatus]|uniref:Regulatory protein FmdB Zinc ribbon domain-containing protein n=1 Tax=Effusibacillus consociatus TaxID=1117041 RepID=A0ABV9Q2G5_9BACL